jgi:hypothetical protein
MIDDQCLQSIRSNSFRISLKTVTVTQDISPNPVVFEGSGSIVQTEDGAFHFDTMSSQFSNTDPVRWFNSSFSTRPGQIFPQEKYYKLAGEDFEGRKWLASQVLPKCSWPAKGMPSLSGKLRRLETTVPGPPHHMHSCELHFFEKLELPIWPKVGPTQFQTEFAELEVRQHQPDHFTIEAKSDRTLPPAFPVRIEESLRFLTATECSAQIITFSEDRGITTHIYPKQDAPLSKKFVAPLSGPHSSGFLEEGWVLFKHYLNYVSKEQNPNYWNHITYYLHNARTGSASSADAWALSICVAVEGLSHMLETVVDPTRKKLVQDLRAWLMPQVQTSPEFSTLADRLGGVLGMMMDVRVIDRLQPLADVNHITDRYLKAWQKLRNKFVHPKGAGLSTFADSQFQQLIDLLYQVTTLMYEIVFHIIGYSGSYTDYGVTGWPIRNRRIS